MSADPHGAAEMVPSGWGFSGAGIPPVDIFILKTDNKQQEQSHTNDLSPQEFKFYLLNKKEQCHPM